MISPILSYSSKVWGFLSNQTSIGTLHRLKKVTYSFVNAICMQIMYQSIPKPPIPPRATPGHLTRVKLRTVGNLTQDEARPAGHLTFLPKRLSAVGNKRISQFFASAREPRSRVVALVNSTWVFFCCCRFI